MLVPACPLAPGSYEVSRPGNNVLQFRGSGPTFIPAGRRQPVGNSVRRDGEVAHAEGAAVGEDEADLDGGEAADLAQLGEQGAEVVAALDGDAGELGHAGAAEQL